MRMMGKLRRLVIVILAVSALLSGVIGGYLILASLDRKKVHETQNAQDDKKAWFVETFMPGVNPADVLSLNYVRTGGREPPYIGVMELTTNGLAKLRDNSEHVGTGTFMDHEIFHLFAQPEVIHDLASHVRWWNMDESQAFETRYIHWKGDHASKFFIPSSGKPVYVEAVVH